MTKVIFHPNIGQPTVVRVAAIRVDTMFDQFVTSGLRHHAIDDAIDLIAGCALGALPASMACDLIIAVLVLIAIHLLKEACRRAGLGSARRSPEDLAKIPCRTARSPMPRIAATIG